jgi:hypothetical protein
MTAQISPNRMEVSDRFPMLGFAVRTSQPDVEAEVVIASDISLFSTQNRQLRTPANFYTSREHGTLTVPRGDGVFVVPPEVLARFIGSEKLYFGLATGRSGNGGLQVDALPREGSPYVSLRGFTGRTLRRAFGSMRPTAPRLEWAGDQPRPGSETAPSGAASPAVAGGTPGASLPPVPYDDGFGPMPEIPARESRYAPQASGNVRGLRGIPLSHAAASNGAGAGRTALALGSGYTAQQALDYIRRLVEQVVDVVGSDATPPSLWRLGGDSAAFITAWETVLTPLGWTNSTYAFMKALPGLARSSGVTLSIGPTISGGMFDAGVGVVFAPDGQVALFGQTDFEISISSLGDLVDNLKIALAASMKLGYNNGGLDGFESLGKVAGLMEGVEIVVGAEVWLDRNGRGLGGAVSIGVGFSVQLSAEEAGTTPAIVPPALPGDPRQRAERIGGGFGQRIGEALDLGLEPDGLTRLLDTLDPPATAKPLGGAMGSPVWSIQWDDIQLVAQPTDKGCWATTLAMLIGWRDQVSIAPETIAGQCGRDIANGLPWAERADVARQLGLGTVPPQCFMPEAFKALIENHGPLYVGKMASATTLSGHAVLVAGMYSDGTDHFIRVVDPWDRAVGTPGAPGAHGPGHTQGSRYIIKYEDFQAEYEMAADGDPAYVQIIYAGVPAGRVINRSLSAPTGFAMGGGSAGRKLAPPPAPHVREMSAAEIAGTAIDVITNNTGDIRTNLANWSGIKHPHDQAPRREAAFEAGEINLRDWPMVGGTFGLDDIYCWLKIRWQYNGTSLGRVYITADGHDDAVGWGLTVTATIEDDSRLYARSSQARAAGPDQVPALHINIDYVFDETIVADQVANTRVSLFADGTHAIESRWVQHSRPGGGNPTNVVRPFEHA